MPCRKQYYTCINDYRWQFNGKEADNEIKGAGNSYNYGFRMYDPRLGRFFAVDPLAGSFPWNSPYAFSENQVINAVELEGLEKSELNGSGGKPSEKKKDGSSSTTAQDNTFLPAVLPKMEMNTTIPQKKAVIKPGDLVLKPKFQSIPLTPRHLPNKK